MGHLALSLISWQQDVFINISDEEKFIELFNETGLETIKNNSNNTKNYSIWRWPKIKKS